jgi:hypothetical protein
MNGHREAAIGFVHSAKGVVGAVDMFRTALAGGDQTDIDFAVDILAKAADAYSGDTETYGRMAFDEIAATPETAAQRERLAGDILMSALVDLNVAQTLIVAGGLTELPGSGVAAPQLDEARDALDSITNAAALPLGKPLTDAAPPARFGFDELVPSTPVSSSDIASAKANYEKRVSDFFASLVDESKRVVAAGFEALKTRRRLSRRSAHLAQRSFSCPKWGV